MKIKIPRISTGELVDVIYTDLGDVRKIYDKNGNPHEGYASRFEWEGKTEYSKVLKISLVPRYSQDCEFLKKFDLDLTKAIFE